MVERLSRVRRRFGRLGQGKKSSSDRARVTGSLELSFITTGQET